MFAHFQQDNHIKRAYTVEKQKMLAAFNRWTPLARLPTMGPAGAAGAAAGSSLDLITEKVGFRTAKTQS